MTSLPLAATRPVWGTLRPILSGPRWADDRASTSARPAMTRTTIASVLRIALSLLVSNVRVSNGPQRPFHDHRRSKPKTRKEMGFDRDRPAGGDPTGVDFAHAPAHFAARRAAEDTGGRRQLSPGGRQLPSSRRRGR